MATCDCPDAVIFSLRGVVQIELNKVKAIISTSLFFDEAVRDVVGLIESDVDAAVNAIPSAVALDFTDIAEYLTCPLLPLALGLQLTDIQALDPTVALEKIKGLKTGEVANARQSYESSFTNAPNAKLVKIARVYVKELTRLRFDALGYATAVLISATVLTVCGREEFEAGPYQEFANVIADFSFDGGVPGNLSNNSQAIVQKLLNGEAKLKALRATISV